MVPWIPFGASIGSWNGERLTGDQPDSGKRAKAKRRAAGKRARRSRKTNRSSK